MKQGFIVLFILTLIVALSVGCRKETFDSSSSIKLRFSTDTLTFDTVFTTIGSVTLPLKVYNDSKNSIKISSVTLAGGSNSNFRINVDGLPGDAEDVEVRGHDSVYVFVEVTVDPNNGNNPLLILDSLLFLTNGNNQKVILAAWGQDAYFHVGEEICDTTWHNDKPHVVFNSVLISQGCKLTIDPGVTVYFSDNSSMYVFGTLEVNGGCDLDTVTFRGIRLESFYDELPGQWGGVFIFRGSTGNRLTNLIIENCSTGLTVGADTSSDLTSFTGANAPDVVLDKVIIRNSYGAGLFGFLSVIDAENCLFYNAGDNLTTLALGGTYNFTHCDFLNYGSVTTNHDKPILLMSNIASNEALGQTVVADLNATFTNCILDGSLDEELQLENDVAGGAQFNFTFENSLVKVEQDTFNVYSTHFTNCLINENPQFVSRGEDNYHLQDFSPCVGSGKVGTPVFDDLDCNSRDGSPDMGSYEYLP